MEIKWKRTYLARPLKFHVRWVSGSVQSLRPIKIFWLWNGLIRKNALSNIINAAGSELSALSGTRIASSRCSVARKRRRRRRRGKKELWSHAPAVLRRRVLHTGVYYWFPRQAKDGHRARFRLHRHIKSQSTPVVLLHWVTFGRPKVASHLPTTVAAVLPAVDSTLRW